MSEQEASGVLSVEEARERIVRMCPPRETEYTPLEAALYRTAATDITAAESLPPFPNSAMDGYALRAEDTTGASGGAPVELRVVGEVAAGAPVVEGSLAGATVRIFTGAEVPAAANAVVPQEWVEREGDRIRLGRPVEPGGFIRPAGRDVGTGMVALRRGEIITPGHIALLAALGQSTISVTRKPRVAVLTTGNELLSVGSPLTPGRIRNSNGPMLAAQLRSFGADVVDLGVAADTLHALREKLGQARTFDLVISSGGVSVGDYDLVKQVLGATGEIAFWRVHIRPGRPLAFGTLLGTPFIGLPGNPASSFVCAEQFARPAVWAMLGRCVMSRPEVEARYQDEARNHDGRQTYLRVRVRWEPGGFVAEPAGGQDSSMISSLAAANGLLVIPAGVTSVSRGETCRVQLLEPFQ
jgi:molybdopterin molybdotransferase